MPAAFDGLGSPAIPYMCAWKEDQKTMWYEFASDNLLEIMDCSCRELPVKFRESVVDRYIYKYQDSEEKVQKEVVRLSECKPTAWTWRRNPYEYYLPTGTEVKAGAYAPADYVCAYNLGRVVGVIRDGQA